MVQEDFVVVQVTMELRKNVIVVTMRVFFRKQVSCILIIFK